MTMKEIAEIYEEIKRLKTVSGTEKETSDSLPDSEDYYRGKEWAYERCLREIRRKASDEFSHGGGDEK